MIMSKVYTFASAGQNEVMDNLVAVFGEIVDERKSKNFVNNDSYKEKNKSKLSIKSSISFITPCCAN